MNKNKLEWVYNRLKLMSLGEISHRTLNVLQTVNEKNQRAKTEKRTKLFKTFKNYYCDDLEHITNYYDSNEELKNKLFKNAENILGHKISFFSSKEMDLGNIIEWHKDYTSNKIFPRSFYSDINYRDSEAGNTKYIWELNRFQHLFPLSQAYILSGDDKYADGIINQIIDWIDNNPYLIGINWTSSLELSLRLISWSWGLFSLDKKKYPMAAEIKEKISTSIHQQAEYIYNHLSAYSSANDHLIGEAMGLAIIGTFFDYGKDSIRWRKKGIKVLFDELDKQVFDDGLDKEQAFGYHCFVLNMYLTTFVLLEKANINIPGKYWQKLEKMAECIMNFSDSNFNLPNFGDSDDSFILKLDNCFDDDLPIQRTAIFLLNASSIIFDRQDFKYLTKHNLDEQTLWMFAKDKIGGYFNSSAILPSRQSLYLEKSGYVILKDKNTDAFIDVGSLGYLSIAAHGHSDALSLCLNYKNKEFLTDPGTFSYDSQPKWRSYFRSTKAHNTIEIDGQNQSQMGGSFMWLKKAEATVDKAVIDKDFDYVKAHHDGYIKQNIPVIHQRELLFVKDKFIIVVDKLINKNSKPHKYSLHWHTEKNCHTELNPKLNLCKITNQDENIFIKTFSDTKIEQKRTRGSENPILGWTSKNFDTKNPSDSIEVNFETACSPIIISIIHFDESLKFNYESQQLKIVDGEKTYHYKVKYGQDLILEHL